MNTDILPWIVFNALIIICLCLDLFVFHRSAHKVSTKEALSWTIVWISLALLFNVYVYYARGSEAAVNFLTGYLIEESLSIDNLFVFLLIFKYFHTPESSMHKVLFWGVLGAVILRALFIWAGIELITRFHWMIYIFGVFLIFTGIKLWLEKDKKIEPEKNPIIKLARYLFPVTDKYEDDKFFVKKAHPKKPNLFKTYATPLFIVLISIETTDVIFALDSIPAILAITYDPFIVYTSNIFAILGLRALFFVLSHVMTLFHYLHYGLSIILVFIGFKMVIADIYKVPTLAALAVVFLVILASIGLSILYPVKNENRS